MAFTRLVVFAALAASSTLVYAQDPSTCALPPLQTAWEYEAAVKNPGTDHGAPFVAQGKNWQGQPKKAKGWRQVKNVILTIPDGFGPASEALARNFVQWKNTQGWNKVLASDTIQVGAVRTRSTDSLVTDSAASATAYSCAIKTYNGGIAVDEDGNPCGTVLEAAKAAGFKTGLIATSRITHATPASFASHVWDRDQEHIIAEQLVGNTPLGPTVDVLLGGGFGFFLPNSTSGSSRPDGVDVFEYARKQGYNVFTDRAGFDALKGGKAKAATKPYLGLFTRSHMSYEIDRDPAKEPSLVEMAKTAINSLKEATKHSDKGYFIMVEASRIDHAGHGNDAVAHLHDIIEYNELVEYLKSVVDDDKWGQTVMLGTADHECGALTLGGIVTTGEYQWSPSALDAGQHSAEFLNSQWSKFTGADQDGFLKDIFAQYGIFDPNTTEIEVAKEYKAKGRSIEMHLGQSINRRAMLKWGSGGHSAVDVNLIAYGPQSEKLVGNHDNTEVGLFIADVLKLDLPAVADRLNAKKNERWLVDVVGRDKVEDGVHAKRGLEERGCGCGVDHHLM
ncbi:alkaline-phosphatase-like protein [Earliella scabrosa]|nr:alkaline-phosphatase-like protein [Earliella scabrosa]